ncbi:pleckstrin-2-like [Orbicella faveolata]|uniref:pleckstrin-2-like n=1 Tax=Orbicella faveolata TaxID=48498 RepID=UPI0009E5AAFD|nr:pleckstrin-2-like [Orbicella faveolata]
MDSKKARKLKEGFLVKKGHVRHNWKTRWFILYDEALVYFKKKNQIMYNAGEIPLRGCFLVSPCTEYTKKEGVFRITTKENIEYLLQAANEEEREEWTTAIANAVRRLDIKFKCTDSEEVRRSVYPRTPVQFTPTQIREMVEAMQDADAGIPLGTHMCHEENKLHKLCFTGEEITGSLVRILFTILQGHVRHNWKTRKFILCKDPTMLFYCRPSKASVPVGQIKLVNSEVKTLKSEEEFAGAEYDPGSTKQTAGYTFLLRTRKGTKYIFRAASEEDRMDWVQTLQTVCENT